MRVIIVRRWSVGPEVAACSRRRRHLGASGARRQAPGKPVDSRAREHFDLIVVFVAVAVAHSVAHMVNCEHRSTRACGRSSLVLERYSYSASYEAASAQAERLSVIVRR